MSWSALLAEDERLAREAAELASEGERFLAGSSSISIAALTVRGLDLLEKRRAWLQTAERELTPNTAALIKTLAERAEPSR